jgi:hypothetical protein
VAVAVGDGVVVGLGVLVGVGLGCTVAVSVGFGVDVRAAAVSMTGEGGELGASTGAEQLTSKPRARRTPIPSRTESKHPGHPILQPRREL